MDLLEEGQRSKFLYLQLGFSCYLRPSENNRLSLGCLVAPAAKSTEGLNKYSLLLSPWEQRVPTKMGKFDDSVLLDDTRAGWLGRAMMLHVKTRRRELLSRGL
eukprot:6800490-Karenia_brevis.AAC.1